MRRSRLKDGSLNPISFIVLVIFLQSTYSLPTPGACPSYDCTGSGNVLAFQPQHTYVYKFESTTETVLSGTSTPAGGPTGKLQFSANAELQAISPCQFGLSISQVQVTGATGKKHADLTALEGKAVQFGLQDGQLVPEMCVDGSDQITTINLKRAIASLLQVSTSSKEQTDVFGKCSVDVVSVDRGGEGATLYNTFTDLNRCQKRENIISDMPSTSYLLNSDSQAAPFLRATQKTQKKVKGGILEAATSQEDYIFQPFSNQGTGAETTVHANLFLKSVKTQVNFVAPAHAKIESVVYEPPHNTHPENSDSSAVVPLLINAGNSMAAEVGEQSASLLHQLVREMRLLSKENLFQLFAQVKAGTNMKNKKAAKKMFIDALSFAGTGESIEFLVELIKSKEVDDPSVFYSRLPFVRHASLDSVKALTGLVESGNPPRELVFGAGSLVGNYLSQHNHKADRDVDKLLIEIAKPLSNCNAKTHEAENKILIAMKGIHNAHYIPDAVADKLKECATNKKISSRVRSAALDSIQGDSANKKLKQVAYDILGDLAEDSELRIKAYLVLATCPCGNVAKFVQNLLEKEPVNQVGSFIVTHIRNLRASSNPEKIEAKKYLTNIILPANKFPLDLRKYSSNTELSYLFGHANAAASGEANVIFSQKSFLPRSTNLNLTTNLFGHSFNLLEVGLRAENMEHILESYFGPKGYFNTRDAKDVFDSGNKTMTALAEKIRDRARKAFRSRRSVTNADLDRMATKVQLQDDHDNVNLDMYVKLFGAELAFYSYYGDPRLNPSALVDKIFDGVDNIIKQAKHYNYKLKQNLFLFDSELVYPTASGFPLKLKASSTAALNLQLAGDFDIHAITKDPQNAQVRFNFMPSAAVELNGEFEMDYFVASSGLKHTATLHSSTGVDLNLKVLNGKGFDMKIGTPLAKQEIVTAKSELFATSRDKKQLQTLSPLTSTVPRRDYHGCFEQLSPLLGVTFCFDLGFPYDNLPKKGPYFPLNGPAKLVMSIKKDDKGISGYQLKALYKDDDPDARSFELTFSIPDAKVDHTTSFLVLARRKPHHEFKMSLTSPITTNPAIFAVVAKNNEQEHSLDIKLDVGVVKFNAKAGLQVSDNTVNHAVYKPVLEYSGSMIESQEQEVRIDGTIVMDRNKAARQLKYTLRDLSLNYQGNTYVMDGFFSKDQENYGLDVTLKYDKLAKYFKVKGDLKHSPNTFHTYLEGHSSQHPDFSFAINYDLKHDKGMLDNKLKVHHGIDLKNEINCFTLSQYYKFVGGGEGKDFELTTKNLVSYPALEVKLHLDAEATRKSFHYLLESGFDRHQLSSEMSLKHGIPGPDGQLDPRGCGGYELALKVGANDRTIEISSGRQIITADTSKLHFEAKLLPTGNFFKVNTDVTHRFQKNDLKLKATSVFTLSGDPTTYTLCTGMQRNLQNCEGHIKLSKGDEDVFLVKAEGTRGEPQTGKFTVLLKNYLEGSGEFSHSRTNNEGNLKAEFISPKLDRKVKINGELKPGAKATTRVATFEVLLDADRDASKRIFFESNIDIAKDGRTYDTKSSVTFINQKFILALKGVTASRTPTDNGVLMRFDSQLELPSKQKISLFSDLIQLQPKDGNGVVTHFKLDDGQGAKLNYEGKYTRVTGFVTPTYDATGKLNLLANKKDINIVFNIANKNIEDKQSIDYKLDVTGSAMPQPFASRVTVELLDQPRYQLKANYGDKLSADVTARISLHDEKEQFADVTVDAKTSIEGYEVIKYSSSFKSHIEDENKYEMVGKEWLEINGARKYDAQAKFDANVADGHVECVTEVVLFLGPNEQEPRIFTHKLDYTGLGLLRSTLDNPQKLYVSGTLKHGAENSGVILTAEQYGDGTPSGKISIEAHTPIEGYEVINIIVDHKSTKGNKLFESKVTYNLGERSHFEMSGKVDLSEHRRSFAVQVQRTKPASAHPILNVHLAYTKATASEFAGELKFAAGEATPYNLEIVGNAKYPGGIDDFELSGVLNTDKVKNVKIEIANKPGGKGGRRISVSAKSAEKTYFQGSTNYNKRDDGRTVTYDGQGNIKFGEESRSSTFRLVRTNLNKERDSETGFDTKLNADITGSKGKMTFEAHGILTDKTIQVYDKWCNEENKCALIEIHNTLKAYDASGINIENRVALDVHHFTALPAFRFTGKYDGKGWEYEHRVSAELGSGSDITRYIYESFIKNQKAGLHLTLPKRTMTLDATLTRPQEAGKGKSESNRNYKLEVICALDKLRKPDQKLTLINSFEVKKVKDGVAHNFDVKITHPSLTKDLVITSKTLRGTGQVILDSTITFDTFSSKNNAIIISLKNSRLPVNDGNNMTCQFSINSKGQNLDFKVVSHILVTNTEYGFGSFATIKDSKLGVSESGVLFNAKRENILFFITAPTCDILRLQGECKRARNEDTRSNFELTALQTMALTGEFVGFKQFKIQGFNKNKPNEKLVYSGSFTPQKEMVLQGEQLTGTKSAKLFHLRIALDSAHFLQTDQSVNTEQVKKSFELLQKSGKATGDRLAALVADITKDATNRGKAAIEAFKKAQPNTKPLVNHIRDEYEAIINEIKTDTQVQEIIDLIKKFVTGAAQVMSKAVEIITVQLDKISTKMNEFTVKFTEFASKLGPVVTEAIGKITKSLTAVFASVIDIFGQVTASAIQVIKDNSEELQRIFTIIVEFLQEQSQQLRDLVAEASKYIDEFVTTIMEQLRSMPIIDKLKEHYTDIYEDFVSRFDGFFQEIAENLVDILPTEELKDLVQKISKYIGKKIRNEPVDESHELEILLEQFMKAIRALLKSADSYAPAALKGYSFEDVFQLVMTPIAWDNLLALPKFVNVRFSLIDLLSSENVPSAADLLATYSVPRHLNDIFPPHKAFAQISASQHFITFDGDHYTLKGDCHYLLARDFDDGNFSLTVELAGGKLRSISLFDKTDNVKLKADHSVVLNGQAIELPYHQNQLAIYRTLREVHVKSRYGVLVSCDLQHELCSFSVNGYYFGKTRGLLGTISNEKYDDLALPNGKIATTVQQFANAYKLIDSCANQAPVEHKHTSHKECTQAFTERSSLRACYPFVDVVPYRQACDDALDDAAGNKEAILKAICSASAAYVAKCRYVTFLHPNLPAACAQCTFGNKEVDFGSTAAVKTPQGKADIVILVEDIAENEAAFNDFLIPITNALTNDLKDRGITDARFILIGYGRPGQKWPAFYTSNGKFVFDGKRPTELTFGTKAGTTSKVDRHPILDFLDRLRDLTALELGQTQLGQAFEYVMQYPFRADAAKSVVLLKHSSCEKSPIPFSLQKLQMVFIREFFQDRGIAVTFLHPLDIVTVGDKKLIGFDADNALTFTKKPVDSALRSEIDYSANSCAPFIDEVQPTVISMKNFKELKTEARKKFLQAASTRLATVLSGTEMTQSCECRLRDGLHTEARCSVTATKEATKSTGSPKKGVKS